MCGFGATRVAVLGRLQKESPRRGLFALLQHGELLGQQAALSLYGASLAALLRLQISADGYSSGNRRYEQYQAKAQCDQLFQAEPFQHHRLFSKEFSHSGPASAAKKAALETFLRANPWLFYRQCPPNFKLWGEKRVPRRLRAAKRDCR